MAAQQVTIQNPARWDVIVGTGFDTITIPAAVVEPGTIGKVGQVTVDRAVYVKHEKALKSWADKGALTLVGV